MNCPIRNLALVVTALLAVSATPSLGQQFEYTPYRGSNNTGQPTTPPPDDYTPSHQAGASAPAPASGASPSTYQGASQQDGGWDTYDGNRTAPRSGGAYSSAPKGTYSPSEDVFSPSRGGQAAPPPANGDAYSPTRDGRVTPPRGVGGPPPNDFAAAGMPRVEVQAAAPDGSVPPDVREHDARRAAIQGWRSKVASRFGREYSQWRIAAGKHVDCHPDRRDGIVCIASAQPVRGASDTRPWNPDAHY